MRLDPNVKAIFNEALDMKDDQTFLLMTSLNEAEQNNAVIILASKLYKMITNKLEDMDFREIELSKGDVTRMKQYKQTRECIDVLANIAKESGSGEEEVRTIDLALSNVEKLRPVFTMGFKNNIDFIKYFYDTIVLGIISDIGFMTTVCVEFIKNPNSTVSLEITNLQTYKSKFYLVHKDLEKFNKAVAKGEIEKTLKALVVNKAKGVKMETTDIDVYSEGIADTALTVGKIAVLLPVAGVTGLLVSIIGCLLPILRDLAYLFYSFRVHISDWFKLQSELLEANSIRLKSLKSEDGRDYKEIAKSQAKWAERMASISDMLAVKYVPAEKNVQKQIEKDKKTTVNKDEIDQPSIFNNNDNPASDQPSLF